MGRDVVIFKLPAGAEPDPFIDHPMQGIIPVGTRRDVLASLTDLFGCEVDEQCDATWINICDGETSAECQISEDPVLALYMCHFHEGPNVQEVLTKLETRLGPNLWLLECSDSSLWRLAEYSKAREEAIRPRPCLACGRTVAADTNRCLWCGAPT